VTRQTAAINVRPGHDRPERARVCLLTGEVAAAAAADYANDRLRLGETPGRGAAPVSDHPEGGPAPGPARASARDARPPRAGRADGTSTRRGGPRQPLSDQERAAIRQAGADDARRSRAEQGFPERIEDPAAVAVLAALLRDARPPPRNEKTRPRPNQRPKSEAEEETIA
jgi:hypothetical protein